MTEEPRFNKTAYVEHPCSKDNKRELNGKGFRVVDARFKPEKLEAGDKLIEKPKAEQVKPDGDK